MKKIVSLLLIGIMLFGLTGCGNEQVSGDKVTLRLGLPGGGDLTPMELVESFKAENPDIDLVVEEAPGSDFKKKLKIQIASNSAPDVFWTDSGYTATLGSMGAAVNLAPRIEKDINVDEYSSTLFAGNDGKGNVWGIPHGLNALAVYYNKELLDKEGIPYPTADWTYDDMFEIARKLTKDIDGDGEIDQYGMTYGSNITEGWLPFVTANGGAPLDETRTKSMFSDPKTVEGLAKYAIPQKEGFAPTLEWSRAQGGGTAAFYNGKQAMMLTLSSQVAALNANAPADFEYDVQSVPVGWDGERHSIYVPNMWVIFSKSDEAKQDAAWRWIKHFISEESQKIVADKFLAGFPIKLSALNYIESKTNKPANISAFYNDLTTNGVTLFENGTYEEWKPMIDQYAVLVRQGEISAEEAAKKIDAELIEILK